MQGEEEQQTEGEATPRVLDYAPPPRRRKVVDFVLWGVILSIIYFFSWFPVFWIWARGSALWTVAFVAMNLPIIFAAYLLRAFGMQVRDFPNFYYVIGESLIYGFGVALVIHWFKRWRR